MPRIRMKKQLYNKKKIDKMFKKALYSQSAVPVIKFTSDDKSNFKLSPIKKKENTSVDDQSIKMGTNVFKFQSPLKPNKEIPSTSTLIVDEDRHPKCTNVSELIESPTNSHVVTVAKQLLKNKHQGKEELNEIEKTKNQESNKKYCVLQ